MGVTLNVIIWLKIGFVLAHSQDSERHAQNVVLIEGNT